MSAEDPTLSEHESLLREVATLRQRVGELQRRVARFSDGSTTTSFSGVDVSMSEREELLVEAERIAHMGSWVWDLESNKVFWSDELFRILGYDPVRDPATTEAFFAAVHPDDVARVRAVSAQSVATGVSQQVDYRVLRKDGAVRHATMDGALLFDKVGKLRRVVGTVLDVTDAVLMRERLVQAEKLEAIGRLAGGIAHDFNNLLTIISGSLAMLDAENVDVGNARHATDAAQRLTSRLLAFGRRSRVEQRAFDMNTFVARTRELVAGLLGEQVEIRCTLAPDLPQVAGDPSLLEPALINLLLNARDAMPKGGVIQVETRASQVDGVLGVELAVTDHGVGMDAATRARLFEPFFTTKQEGYGTGLGLAMVHGTVEQQGGAITVDSSPGIGSTFTIRLPVATSVSADLPQPGRGDGSVAAIVPPLTILIVEDQPAVAKVVARMLEHDGHRVQVANLPSSAIELALQHAQEIDLLICDLVLPEMKGPELVKELKRRGLTPPVLFMSGYSSADFGANIEHQLLTKPIQIKDLRAAIARATETTRA